MTKNRVIVFTKNNARIFINPPNITALRLMPNVLVNPEMSHLKGVPPHFWKISKGKIKEMDPIEKEARKVHQLLFGVENSIESPFTRALLNYKSVGLILPVIAGIAYAAMKFWG